MAIYLADQLGDDYILAPETSIDLRFTPTRIPRQFLVHTARRIGNHIALPEHTTATIIHGSYDRESAERYRGLWVYRPEDALFKIAPRFFQADPVTAELLLRDAAEPDRLLKAAARVHNVRAIGRVVGAYRQIGHSRVAETLLAFGRHIGDIRPSNPFSKYTTRLGAMPPRPPAPAAARAALMWGKLRTASIAACPEAGERPTSTGQADLLRDIDERYTDDAYHSLSIEGYAVTRDLIEHIRRGGWNPEAFDPDRAHRNAMAAKGYYDAFLQVREALARVCAGEQPGRMVRDELPGWYAALFGPAVDAGLLAPHQLAGYRDGPIYIRGSRHVPPPSGALRDLMDVLFDALENEDHGPTAAIGGHFLFTWTHPYMDGNGRIGRFLMNFMLCSHGDPWTIIRSEHATRSAYLTALEQAPSHEDYQPFARFVTTAMQTQGKRSGKLPAPGM